MKLKEGRGESFCVTHAPLTIGSNKEHKFPWVPLTASFNKHDNLIMGMFCYIPAINQDNLVSFIQTRDTEVSLQHKTNEGLGVF